MEQAVLKEMSINMDLYGDKLPSNEEIEGRKIRGDNYATDRSASMDD
jgi:hypothetical protein